MRYDWEISREMIRTVAIGLGDIANDFVFVGGSTLGFYIDQGAEKLREVRGSEDVDVVVEVSTRTAFAALEAKLRDRSFCHDTSPGAPEGFGHPIYRDVDGTNIAILSAPYFLASKIAAFTDRGKKPGDYMFSRDLEDIVTIFDGRDALLQEIHEAPSHLAQYIRAEISALLADSEFLAAMPAFILPDARARGRIDAVKTRMLQFCGRGP